MRNQEEALARIVRHLNGQPLDEVADRILALFHAPPRWKPDDPQEVYCVSECGDIQTATFRYGEPRSEALWAFGNCCKSPKDAARARDAFEHVLINIPTHQA